jgi:hypothetical protein
VLKKIKIMNDLSNEKKTGAMTDVSSGTTEESNVNDSRGNVLIARKFVGDREARVLVKGFGQHGGSYAIVLWLFKNKKNVYAAALPFEDAVNKGNEFLANGRTDDIAKEDANNETFSIKEEEKIESRHLEEFKMGTIRTTVNLSPRKLYFISVYVEPRTFQVVNIFRNCNTCPLFTLSDATNVAKRYLPILQGWQPN